MIIKFLMPLLFVLPQFAKASALVIRDNQKLEVRVIAKLHYYGEAATEEIAAASTDEIIRMWSKPDVKVMMYEKNPTPDIFGRPSSKSAFAYYKPIFEIEYVVHKEKPVVSESCANNLIEVKNPEAKPVNSFYKSVGSREAVFYTNDDLGNSTTAAHEFGHGLGLDHPDVDQRHATSPGIMFARGTMVRSEFRIDPKADTNNLKTGRINPYLRVVRQDDIKAIKWATIWYDTNVTCLGQGRRLLDY